MFGRANEEWLQVAPPQGVGKVCRPSMCPCTEPPIDMIEKKWIASNRSEQETIGRRLTDAQRRICSQSMVDTCDIRAYRTRWLSAKDMYLIYQPPSIHKEQTRRWQWLVWKIARLFSKIIGKNPCAICWATIGCWTIRLYQTLTLLLEIRFE